MWAMQAIQPELAMAGPVTAVLPIVPWIVIPVVTILLPLAALVYVGWLGTRFVRAKELAAQNSRDGFTEGNDSSQAELIALRREVHLMRERQEFMEGLLAKSADS